nr:hypothetical protein [Tanacetum cinerariifolium]
PEDDKEESFRDDVMMRRRMTTRMRRRKKSTQLRLTLLRAESLSTSYPLPLSTPPSGTPPLLHIPLPTSTPPLILPSTSYKADVPKVKLPPWKRLCIVLGPRFKVGKISYAPTIRPTGGFRANFKFVGTLDDEIGKTLRERDRFAYARTTRLMKIEARLSREAWVQSMDASDTACAEFMSLRTIVLAQQMEIAGL